MSKAVSVGLGADDATGHNLKELILQGIFSRTMEDQIREAFIERNGGSDFFAPERIDVFFRISDDHHIIEVTTEYSIVTLAGVKTRSIYSVIPLYGDPVLMLRDEEAAKKDEEKDNIWSLSNFDRGEAFRDRYGANLPKTFPVIDKVDGGEITAIRSIDLTSPYYQDISNVQKKIRDDIKDLSRFEPQSAVINGNTYSVDHIDSRHLTVIIPENSGEVSKAAVEELKGYAFVQGVILDICECATSERYTG